jgi:hypothetical protein
MGLNIFKKRTQQKKVFFVTGFPRSGTHWVANLLNLHPQVSISDEFMFDRIKAEIDKLTQSDRSRLSEASLKKAVNKQFYDMVKNIVIQANSSILKKDVIWHGDCTPRELYPLISEDAPHFYIYRDVRDVLVSYAYLSLFDEDAKKYAMEYKGFRKNIALFDKDSNHFLKKPKELLSDGVWVRDQARMWAQSVKKNLEIANSFKKPFPICLLRYEEIHSDVELGRKKMYQFLGLDPSKAKPLTELTRPGFKAENPKSIYRKGIIGDWKNYFNDSTIEIVEEECRPLLLSMGYEV